MKAPSRVLFKKSQVEDSEEIMKYLMNEIINTERLIKESQQWLTVIKIDSSIYTVEQVHLVYLYTWRSISLLTVICQCLQLVSAYHDHIVSADQREYVGVVTSKSLFNDLETIVNLKEDARIHM